MHEMKGAEAPQGTLSTTLSSNGDQAEISTMQSSNTATEDEWNKAYNMLSRNPKLLTQQILLAALQRQAPSRLITFMLNVNPKVASVPKEGPTPLQVALNNSCSLEVVVELLQACPFALVAKDFDSNLDPLSYAKRFRADEGDLIQLLSRPIQFWLLRDPESPTTSPNKSAETIVTCNLSPIRKSHGTRQPVDKVITSGPREAGETRNTTLARGSVHQPKKAVSSEEPASLLSKYGCGIDTTIPSVTVAPQTMRPITNNTNDPMELKNVKSICMTVLKGHKRLTQNLAELQKNFDGLVSENSIVSLPNIALMMESHGKTILKQVKDKQKKFANDQKIALQQTESNMEKQLQQTELRLDQSIVQRQQETHSKLEVHMDAVVRGLQMRLAKFSNRIEFLEQLVFSSEMKRASSRMKKVDRPPSVITLTVPNTSNANHEHPEVVTSKPSNTSISEYGTMDTWDEADEESPTEVEFLPYGATTPEKIVCDTRDEKRSLLTVATVSDRSESNFLLPSPEAAPKKRWFNLLRKKRFVNRPSAHV